MFVGFQTFSTHPEIRTRWRVIALPGRGPKRWTTCPRPTPNEALRRITVARKSEAHPAVNAWWWVAALFGAIGSPRTLSPWQMSGP